jgi:REP element-mobilizing transposase RayT
MTRRARQLQLPLVVAPSRSRRGRPRSNSAGIPHLRRPAVDPRHPHHVTLRVRRHVWNLRSQRCFRPFRAALGAVFHRAGFRVVHFSVQGNHLHLVVEADDRRSLSNGMRALGIRLAKRLNRLMGTRGPLFVDRYHERVLRSPTQTRNLLRYVLGNRAHHLAGTGRAGASVDPFSSAAWLHEPELLARARSWLLSAGHLRARGPSPPPRGP